MIESTKKERAIKNKERKEKLTEEEKDARKERKLGRKRERLEENSNAEHKRRREGKYYINQKYFLNVKLKYRYFVDFFLVQNGDDDLRERDKYHTRVNTLLLFLRFQFKNELII